MRTSDFATKESLRRPRKSMAGIFFILLGISIFVASQTITQALHDRTKEQLLRFGANLIVQPKGQPFDLYSGVVTSAILLPESHASKVRTIEHNGMLVAVSPKLYERFDVDGKSLLVVGVTPDERKAKPWWLIQKQVMNDQFPTGNQILLGHHVAGYLSPKTTQVSLNGTPLQISGILDETGSPDDFMAFVPLNVLQKMTQKQGLVNVIEISTSCIACKSMNIYGIAEEIHHVLPPDSSVSTVEQIAAAQMGTLNKVMDFTTVIYLVALGLCALLLMNYVSQSVDERRREIGILVALGMEPRKIQWVFISKTLAFAVVGGLLGYVTGSGISVLLGPIIADAQVSLLWHLLPISVVIAIVIAFLSSLWPARRILRLDPVEALREV